MDVCYEELVKTPDAVTRPVRRLNRVVFERAHKHFQLLFVRAGEVLIEFAGDHHIQELLVVFVQFIRAPEFFGKAVEEVSQPDILCAVIGIVNGRLDLGAFIT